MRFFKDRNEKIIFLLAIIGHTFLFLLVYFKLGLSGFMGGGDAEGYIQLAKNLLAGNGFSMAESAPFILDGFRTPMYPVFLAGILFVFKNLYFVSLIQIFLFAVCAVMVYRLGKDVLGSKTALAGSLILILEPTMAYWNTQWITETLFLFLLVLGLYFFVEFYKKGSFLNVFFSALFLGFATLTRPAGQGLWVIFLVLFLFFIKKFNWKFVLISLAVFIASFVAVVSPWLIRNKIYFNTYSFSSADTSVFYGFNLPAYLKVNNLENIEKEPDYLYGLTKNSLAPNISANDLNYHSYFMKKWIKLILADPVGYAKVHLLGLIPYFGGDGYTELARQFFPNLYRPSDINWDGTLAGVRLIAFNHSGLEMLVFWLGKILWSSLYIFALFGMVDLLRRQKYFYLFLFLGIILYFALTIGAVAYSRYRFPINPLIFLLAAIGMREFVLYIKRRFRYGKMELAG